MNCTHIEKLLPLYVEGDLDAERAETVLTHLDACRECQARATEYEESQNWLRSYSPPQFDETFFDGLRQSVQSEIAWAQRRPNFFQLIAPRWGWQPVMAAAMAVLVIVGGLALYARFHRALVNQKQDGEMVARQTDLPPVSGIPNDAGKPAGGEGEKVVSPTLPPKPINSALPSSSVAKVIEPALPAAIARVLPPGALAEYRAEVAAYNNPAVALEKVLARFSKPEVAAEGEAPEPEVAPSTNTVPAPEMRQTEMKTANPNVRIIWLTPKETDSPSIKTSRDSN